MGVTVKYTRFFKIGNVALYQETIILIIHVSKFQYTLCIGIRPVKLIPTPRGISSEWYTIFVLLSEISLPDYVHVNWCNHVQIMPPNANIDETRYFV